MPTDGPHYWPFPVLPANMLTEEHRKEIRFLEAAYQAGFHPCKFYEREYQAHIEQGRYGWIIYRGRIHQGGPCRWEVWLDEQPGRVAAYWVDDFDTAASGVLQWLRGGDVLDILDLAKPRIVKGPSLDLQQSELSGQ
jgi:hypothetical protein